MKRKKKSRNAVSSYTVGPITATVAQSVISVMKKPNTIDEWFVYYDYCDRVGLKFTLKDIAAATSYSYGYIRIKYAEHKAEHREGFHEEKIKKT